MPYLLAQFPEHTEDSIRDLAQYDPSGQAKYITWILKTLRDQGGGLTPEAGANLRSALERFNRVKNYPAFQGKKDINQYTSFDELFTTLADAEQVMSHAERAKKGIEKVTTWKDYTLWRINTSAAAQKFAQNSRLCFCDEPHSTNYTVDQPGQPRTGPPLFGVTQGNEKVAALHPNSQQYHDMQNRPVTGDLRRAVLHLARLSGDPKLRQWYDSQLEFAVQQVKQARERRAQERRRRMVRAFDQTGRALLEEGDGYQFMSARRDTVVALLPDDARNGNQPVLIVVTPENQIAALVDAENGVGIDAQREQLETEFASLIGRHLRPWIKEVTGGIAQAFVANVNEYTRRFEQMMTQLRDRFVDERVHGYTDPRTGVYAPPIPRPQAQERWNNRELSFKNALLKGSVRLRMPGIGFMRVLGYDE